MIRYSRQHLCGGGRSKSHRGYSNRISRAKGLENGPGRTSGGNDPQAQLKSLQPSRRTYIKFRRMQYHDALAHLFFCPLCGTVQVARAGRCPSDVASCLRVASASWWLRRSSSNAVVVKISTILNKIRFGKHKGANGEMFYQRKLGKT